ncbi:MAG: hypothetical protein ACOCUI_04815 [bacterium]
MNLLKEIINSILIGFFIVGSVVGTITVILYLFGLNIGLTFIFIILGLWFFYLIGEIIKI